MKKIITILACSFLIGSCSAAQENQADEKQQDKISGQKVLTAIICKNLPKNKKKCSAVTPTQYTLLQSKDSEVRSKIINWLSDGSQKRKEIVSSEAWLKNYIAMHKKAVKELQKQLKKTDGNNFNSDIYMSGVQMFLPKTTNKNFQQ